MRLQVLAVSDEVDQRIYSSSIRERMGDIDMIIGCGDLPASYLEFLTDALHRPVYYVLGNHAEEITRTGVRGETRHPEGCTDVGFKVERDPVSGLIIAGLPGSPRYSDQDPVQFTEFQMAMHMIRMAPRLIWNKLRYGRPLDMLVTHSPPRNVGDREDTAHQGFQSMHRFVELTKPRYQLHGHIHLYDRSESNTHQLYDTEVINVFPYQRLDLKFDALGGPLKTATTSSGALRAEVDDERTEVNMRHDH
jgi:hypothetical protein